MYGMEGGLEGASGGGLSGMYGMESGLEGTTGAGTSSGTSVQDIMNYKSMLSNQEEGKPKDNQGLNYFIRLQQQKKRELDALLKGDVPLE
jgi:hypothetical protein